MTSDSKKYIAEIGASNYPQRLERNALSDRRFEIICSNENP